MGQRTRVAANRFSVVAHAVVIAVCLVRLAIGGGGGDRIDFVSKQHSDGVISYTAEAATAKRTSIVNLTCENDYNPANVAYSWTRERSSLEHGGHRQLIVQNQHLSKYRFVPSSANARILQINNVSIRDDGSYRCFRVNSTFQRMFRLKVYHDIEQMSIVNADGLSGGGQLVGTVGHEFRVGCVTEKSWPAAMISMRIDGSPLTVLEPMSARYKSSPDINGLQRTELYFTTNKLTHEDDQRLLVCEATLYDVQIKRQKAVRLNVRYSPLCARLGGPFRLGLNRLGNITCSVFKSNPSKNLRFEWLLDRGGGGGVTRDEKWSVHFMFTNESSSTILVKPISLQQIENARISCAVSNGIGVPTICELPVALGAKPDPVTNCQHAYPTNSTLQISCQLGFHQGDPDQQCVLFRLDKQKQMMLEYARARLCAFVIDRTSRTDYHKLKIFSINKFGDSLQQAVTVELNSAQNSKRTRSSSPSSYLLSIFGYGQYKSTTQKVIVFCMLVVLLFVLACIISVCCCYYQDGSWFQDRVSRIGDGRGAKTGWNNKRGKRERTSELEQQQQQKNRMEMFWNTYGRKGEMCFVRSNYSEKLLNEESQLIDQERTSMQNNGQCEMILDHASYNVVPHNNLTVQQQQQQSTIEGYDAQNSSSRHHSCYCCDKQHLQPIGSAGGGSMTYSKSASLRSRKIPVNPPPIEPRRSTSRSRSSDEYGLLPMSSKSPSMKIYSDNLAPHKLPAFAAAPPTASIHHPHIVTTNNDQFPLQRQAGSLQKPRGSGSDVHLSCVYDGKSKVTEC